MSQPVASSDLVTLGMLVEATEGTLETSGAFPVVPTTGFTPEFREEMLNDETILGYGEDIDDVTVMRALNAATPFNLRYGNLLTYIGAALRQGAFPSAVTVVGTSDINVVAGATHLDGTTGWQLTAPTGSFDDLINYDGVTSTTNPNGGAEYLMLKVSNSAQAANNRMRRIKAVWDDGTAKIDIHPGYVAGASGAFAEVMVATTLESLTLTVGRAGRNRAQSVASYSALWEKTDITRAKWRAGWGLVAADLSVSFTGKGLVEVNVNWVGRGTGEAQQTDPTGQGFDDSEVINPVVHSGDSLMMAGIFTDTKALILGGQNLNAYNMTLASGVASVDDIAGSDQVEAVRRGKHKPTGSIDWYVTDAALAEEMTQIGSRTSKEKGIVDLWFQDADGNDIVTGVLKAEFGQTGGIPGPAGQNIGGQLAFAGSQKNNRARSYVHQEFAA